MTSATPRRGVCHHIEHGALTIVLPLPADDQLTVAGRMTACDGVITWLRYQALHAAYTERIADPAYSDEVEFYRVCDPFTQVAASFAVAASVGRRAAESFLDRALACFDRIPAIGRLLRDGLISPFAFAQSVLETANVTDPELLAAIDADTSTTLRQLGGLSVPRVVKTVRATVISYDPDAAHQARESAKAGKRVTLVPLDMELSQLVITDSAENTGLSLGAINAVIAGACPNDPRTVDQRRTDAAFARLTGTAFTCACDGVACTAALSPADVAARCASIVVHVVCRREKLDGADDAPAYLDGFGPISAEHARDIVGRRDATCRDVDLDQVAARPHQAADPYRPTQACDAIVRGVFATCSWPGCDKPAWKSDLDHVCEYNHDSPAQGGATCPCNLNPKCRFHHLLKTYGDGWVDSQFVDASGVIWTEVTTPEGYTVRQQALNGWLVPELGHLKCRHGPQNSPGQADPADEPHRSRTRTQSKHLARAAQRAANRCARLAEEAAYGGPPF